MGNKPGKVSVIRAKEGVSFSFPANFQQQPLSRRSMRQPSVGFLLDNSSCSRMFRYWEVCKTKR